MPEMACPFRCIYCDQTRITGKEHLPDEESITRLIEDHLESFPQIESHIEIAFFGGNFTGLDRDVQSHYLDIAARYVAMGKVHSIRLSTRPDYITTEKLELLARYPVGTIELGAQSLDDEVLDQCGRGHTAEDVAQAALLVRQYGFRLGLQMMVGLPGDSFQKAMETARSIISLGADESRIYPCLVIKGTRLETLFRQNRYNPLSLEEAIKISTVLWLLFEQAGVKVIRLGLHPSESLLGDGLVAGPFHPAFKTMVMSEVWHRQLTHTNTWPQCKSITIEVPAAELNYAIGFRKVNKEWLQRKYEDVKFRPNATLSGRAFLIKPAEG